MFFHISKLTQKGKSSLIFVFSRISLDITANRCLLTDSLANYSKIFWLVFKTTRNVAWFDILISTYMRGMFLDFKPICSMNILCSPSNLFYTFIVVYRRGGQKFFVSIIGFWQVDGGAIWPCSWCEEATERLFPSVSNIDCTTGSTIEFMSF